MSFPDRLRAVAFDLDGTLVDSRRDLAAAVNRARTSYGLPELAEATVVGMVGEGARKLVAQSFDLGDQLAGASPPAGAIALDEALARFFAFYDEGLLASTRAYPGIPELLADLDGRCPLAVLTNKPEGFSRRILEGLGLAGHFAEVVGGDTLPVKKPDPAGLHLLAGRLGVAAGEIVLVGDSEVDAATAAAAGCSFAFVTWGFPTAQARAGILHAYQPAIVATDAAELGRGLYRSPAHPQPPFPPVQLDKGGGEGTPPPESEHGP